MKKCEKVTNPIGAGPLAFCTKPAKFSTPFGLRCQEHADELVRGLSDPSSLMNAMRKGHGLAPLTEEQVRARVRPLS